jgi:hypothetical protein
VYIQFILKYLTLFSSSIDSSFSLSTSTSSSFHLWSVTADSVVYGELLHLDFTSFFPPSTSFLNHSPFSVCLLGWSITWQRAYGGTFTAEGSPYSRWMDLWQVRTTAARAISIPGFCRWQRSNLGGCPGFPRPR